MTADQHPQPSIAEREAAQLVADLDALVRIQTPNPPGAELEAARWLAERLAPIATAVEVQDLGNSRGNVVATFDFGQGPTIVFNTHLDVVPPESPAQWSLERRDGHLYGRGTCDAKGALVAMIAAIERLVRSPEGLQGRLVLAAVADEEVEAEGTRALVDGGLRADAAIVGEPTGNRLVLSSRGALRLAVRFRGRAAHSSTPARGANAIYQAARFIVAIQELNEHLSRAPVPASCAATVVHGGTKLNVVPDVCVVQVDRRLVPGETTAGARREVEALLAEVARHDPRVQWEIEPAGVWLEPFELAPGDKLAATALRALGQQQPGPMFPGGTDAPHLIAVGTPALIVGPGSLAQAHTADEHVALESLLRGVAVYETLGRALLRADDFARP